MVLRLENEKFGKGLNGAAQVWKWKQIWHLSTPKNVKDFFWQANKNLLPTNSNLKTKKVVENGFFPICMQDEETVSHMLWNCTASQDIWFPSNLQTQKWPSCFMFDFWQLWEYLSTKLDVAQLTLAATIMRNIWFRINKFVFKNKFKAQKSIA